MSNDIDICFVGGLFTKEQEDEIINNSIGPIENAANVLQWNIVNGLEANINKRINIINSLYIGSYPKRYKKMYIKTSKFRNDADSVNINVGFINIFGIKHYLRYSSTKKYIKNWANNGKENKVIIAYAMTTQFIKSLKYIKKINPNIKTCIIVPDLPQYMNTSADISVVYKLLKSIEIKYIDKKLKYIDKFVLLTDYMSKVLNVKDYVVVEGIATDLFESDTNKIDESDTNKIDESEKDERLILYTGTLNKKYGILNLIRAFELIENKNYKLILCGYGDSLDEILKAQKRDKRIIFKGQLSRAEVLKLQLKADVLINPRQNIEEFTKYSFPSKNLEYLSSGKPLIGYKLDGIPDEYDDYIHYVDDNSIESLKNKIINICDKSKEELEQIGMKSRDFVINNKNNIIQTRKIIDLIGKEYEK